MYTWAKPYKPGQGVRGFQVGLRPQFGRVIESHEPPSGDVYGNLGFGVDGAENAAMNYRDYYRVLYEDSYLG